MGVTAIVAHSGGPTAVINASLVGVVDEARRRGEIATLLGARHGIDGILREDFVDLFAQDLRTLSAVARSSSSALGVSRRAMTDADFDRVLSVCRAREVRFLFYTGGNGSMGTARQIDVRARAAGLALTVIGIPKTIDNDLAGTDHAPGYGSAARFFASAVRDVGADNRALPGLIQFVEVLGRHAGWIAAATVLARQAPDDAPHLIYVPERRLPLSRLLDDVQRVFNRVGRCLVVVCEGQLDERGEPFGADVRMSSRGPLATNLAHRLALLVTEHLGVKARGEKPGLLGRVSTELRSRVDWDEARLCGQAAVRIASEGVGGVMVTLERRPGPLYASTPGTASLDEVANVERLLPPEWISGNGHDVLPAFAAWVAPLAGPIERQGRLDTAVHPVLG